VTSRWQARLLTGLVAAAFVAVAQVAAWPAGVASAEDNGVGRTPLMGWSTWSFIRHGPTEAKVRAQAQAIHDSGLSGHGFVNVNIDDFYYVCTASDGPAVDRFGRWVVDTGKFPHGMKAMGDFVHGLGLKFGLYVTPGIPSEAVRLNTPVQGTSAHARDIANTSFAEKNYNCKHMVGIDYSKPGAQEFVSSWANLFASYGVDYVKIDGVGSSDIPDVRAWSRALNGSGRKIHLELSNNLSINDVSTWQQLANGWRVSGDIECYKCETGGSSFPLTDWPHVSSRFGQAARWAPFGGPGGFNDLDSLEIGNGANDGLTPDQRRSHLTLWAMAASPLILGTDLTHLDATDMAMLTNDEVLGVDRAGVPATQVQGGTAQVWKARRSDGTYAVALFNTGTAQATVSVSFSSLGISGSAAVRDLWARHDRGRMSSYSASLRPDETRLLKLTP
jgi:hypothetical protein